MAEFPALLISTLQPVSRFGYGCVAELAIRWLRSLGVESWTRNSVRSGDIVPLVSDIDLTIDCGNRSAGEVWRIMERYSRLRRRIPLLGEANLYSDATRHFVLRYHNPLELARDPVLLERHASTRRAEPSLSEAFVFLSRMLEADSRNLSARPALRKRKWRRHLGAAGLQLRPGALTTDGLLDLLEHSVFAKLSPLPIRAVLGELLAPGADFAGRLREHYHRDPSRQGATLLLFPSRCLGLAYATGDLGQLLRLISGFAENERRMLADQVRWELAGLTTQFSWVSQGEPFVAHVRGFLEFLRAAAPGEHGELVEHYSRIGVADLASLSQGSATA